MSETISRIVSTIRLRDIKKLTLKFAGGEPTLSVAAMEWFHDQLTRELSGTDIELYTSVLSNGTNGSRRLLEFLKRPRCGIGISLDGYGSASHDLYRVFKKNRKGSWHLIMRNVDRMLQEGIRPYIMATISEKSAGTLPDLVRWIYSAGLRTRLSVVRQPSEDSFLSYGYDRPREANGAPPLVQLESGFTDVSRQYEGLISAMKSAFEKAFQELEKPEFRIDLRNGLDICELHFEKPVHTACCGIGSSHVVINEDGRLASCPMTLSESPVVPNDDLLESIRWTFDHSPTERNGTADKNCLDCRWFPVCVSGCPVNNKRTKGRAFTVSPLHEFYEYVIPRYVVFFGRKLLQEARRFGHRSGLFASDGAQYGNSMQQQGTEGGIFCDG